MPAEYDAIEEMKISGMIGLGNEGFGKEKITEREKQKLFEDSKKVKK